MRRRVCLALLSLLALLVGSYAAGVSIWTCPIAAVGGSCPGCGLTRATGLLARGEVAAAVRMHPFVLVVPIALAFLTTAVAAPPSLVARLSNGLRAVERRVPVVLGLLLFAVARWLYVGVLGR